MELERFRSEYAETETQIPVPCSGKIQLERDAAKLATLSYIRSNGLRNLAVP